MFSQLHPLSCLVDAGSHVTKSEAIRRYRLLSTFQSGLLQLLCMMQFSFLGRTEEGELYVC
jgi:hypothetical protein